MFFLISDNMFINDKKKKLFISNLKLKGFLIWATRCCWNWPIVEISCLWPTCLYQGSSDRKRFTLFLTKIDRPGGFLSAEIHKSDFNILKLFYIVLGCFFCCVFPWGPIPKIQKRVEFIEKYLSKRTNRSSVAQSIQKLWVLPDSWSDRKWLKLATNLPQTDMRLN